MIQLRPYRLLPLLFLGIASVGYGQLPTCTPNITPVAVHAEGFTERVADIVVNCIGGTPGATLSPTFFFTFNTNITNKQDSNGSPLNLGFSTPQPANVQVSSFGQTAPNTIRLLFTYVVPAGGGPVSFTIQGVRAAPAALGNGTGSPLVTVSIVAVGVTFPGANVPLATAFGLPTLLASNINYGIPCTGSPIPDTKDFQSFSTTSTSSTIRLSEASPQSFAPKDTGTDNGVRILVRLSGYASNARVFIPDAIVGSTGSAPTSAGGYSTTVNGGTYTPGGSQLLLVRVNGADANGAGGTPALATPSTTTSFTTVSEVTLSGGAATIVYEVLDANPNLKEIAQLPVFLVVPQVPCANPIAPPSYTVALAPLSTVSVATATDPIQRFIATTIGTDCTQAGDCTASYFPTLLVDSTPIQISGSSQGGTRSGSLQVNNSGGGVMPFTTSISYQSGTNWLSVTPTSGQNGTGLQLIADPSALAPGTYNATVTVDAGGAGKASVPVVFTVGVPGIKITGVVNAASFKSGLVAPGSFAAIFGTNMGGKSVSVTFNGFQATIVYASATQINVIVPAALGFAPAADVVVIADFVKSDSVKVTVQPNAPGIFTPGVVNFADGSINDLNHPAKRGDIILVFATGLAIPLTGPVTLTIGNQTNVVPAYAGAQGSFPALDQINVVVPPILPATPNPVPLSVCVADTLGTPVCSNAVNLYIK